MNRDALRARLAALAAATPAIEDDGDAAPRVFDLTVAADCAALAAMLDAGLVSTVRDELEAQRAELARCRAGVAHSDGDGRWVWLPWSRTLLHVLPPVPLRALRLDRNRLRVAGDEQARLLRLRVGVVGLSVGAAIAVCMAQQGVGAHFRLADPDRLDVSNLNRLRAAVGERGARKVDLARRAMWSLDPYLRLDAFATGVNIADLDAFLCCDGRPLDLVVEECDDLALKVALRRRARALGVPTLMATSEGGLLDVERFDLEPGRPLFHGLCDEERLDTIAAGDADARAAFVMAILGRSVFSDRTAASLVELGETITSWPQLASAVASGAAVVTEAALRIGLGWPLPSGRYRLDAQAALAKPEVLALTAAPANAAPAAPTLRSSDVPDIAALAALAPPAGAPLALAARQALLDYAALAPSGGNAQPLALAWQGDAVVITVRPEAPVPGMDPERCSVAMAAGSVVETLRLLAPALGCRAVVGTSAAAAGVAGPWRVTLEQASSPLALDPLAHHLRARCTNRRLHHGPSLVPAQVTALSAALSAAVAPCGAGALVLADDDDRARWGALAGRADRLRFLHPPWLAELAAEVRFEEGPREGLDIATLELSAGERATLPLLLDAHVMAEVAAVNGGAALRRPAERAFAASAALLLLHLHAPIGADAGLRAGAALLRAWLAATDLGFAVHPWGSCLFMASLAGTPVAASLAPHLADELEALALSIRTALPQGSEAPFMLLRLSRAHPPSARSARRPTKVC